jgi:holin-like protein
MLGHLTILLSCQLAGEVLVRATGVPVPGAVAGMMLLLIGLCVRGGVADEGFAATCRALLANLSLLFVPAGVGVMVHLKLLKAEWPVIATALVVSTVVTIAVTALVMEGLERLTRRKAAKPE